MGEGANRYRKGVRSSGSSGSMMRPLVLTQRGSRTRSPIYVCLIIPSETQSTLRSNLPPRGIYLFPRRCISFRHRQSTRGSNFRGTPKMLLGTKGRAVVAEAVAERDHGHLLQQVRGGVRHEVLVNRQLVARLPPSLSNAVADSLVR